MRVFGGLNMCQKLPPINETVPCYLGLTKPGLNQVSPLCKCSFVGYIIGTHKNAVYCLNAQVRFLHISNTKLFLISNQYQITFFLGAR
jgi:hypothetical protein